MKRYGLMILGIFLLLLGIIIRLFDSGSNYSGNGNNSESGNGNENGTSENTPVVELKKINLKEMRFGKHIECTRERLLGTSFYETIKVLEDGGTFDNYPIRLQISQGTNTWEDEVGKLNYSEFYEFDESGTKLEGYYIVNNFVFESDLFSNNLIELFYKKLVEDNKDNYCNAQLSMDTIRKEIVVTCYDKEWVNNGDGLRETLTSDSILKNYSSSNSPYKCEVEIE